MRVALAIDPHFDAIDVGWIADRSVDGVVGLGRDILVRGRVQNGDDRRATRGWRGWRSRCRRRWSGRTRATTVDCHALEPPALTGRMGVDIQGLAAGGNCRPCDR